MEAWASSELELQGICAAASTAVACGNTGTDTRSTPVCQHHVWRWRQCGRGWQSSGENVFAEDTASDLPDSKQLTAGQLCGVLQLYAHLTSQCSSFGWFSSWAAEPRQPWHFLSQPLPAGVSYPCHRMQWTPICSMTRSQATRPGVRHKFCSSMQLICAQPMPELAERQLVQKVVLEN